MSRAKEALLFSCELLLTIRNQKSQLSNDSCYKYQVSQAFIFTDYSNISQKLAARQNLEDIVKIIIILLLVFMVGCGHVHCSSSGKNYGPSYAIWTHSKDPGNCAIKSVVWALLITGAVVYIIYRIDKKYIKD